MMCLAAVAAAFIVTFALGRSAPPDPVAALPAPAVAEAPEETSTLTNETLRQIGITKLMEVMLVIPPEGPPAPDDLPGKREAAFLNKPILPAEKPAEKPAAKPERRHRVASSNVCGSLRKVYVRPHRYRCVK